ncbi:MAG TPA: MFS transporter [Nitrososphaerales archaeon]|nr:MFS transporter [Nitrososphaerales archaeon]
MSECEEKMAQDAQNGGSESSGSNNILSQIETGKLTRSHYKVLALSGAGVFMDGYDLFIISVALLQIRPEFSTTAVEISAISSSAILGAVFGAVIFGNLADRLGRKTLYVIDLLFFVVFGAASAFSQNILQLIIFRFLLGIGIGADYPISASYIAEFVSSKHRGRLIASVFAFQGLGILAAVGISILLIPTGPGAWRWMLLSGVFPALIALTLRTRMPETPRWYLSHGQPEKAKRVLSSFFGYTVTEEQLTAVIEKISVRELLLSPYARRVFFTSASWFLVDVGVYGIGILTPTLIQSLYGAKAPILASAETTGILYIFAGIGYLSAIGLIDVAGRKRIQIIGFFGMAIPLALAAYFYSSLSLTALFALFAVFYVLENLGPNTTTWVYPVELFPTRLRGTGHGIAATVGKIGALVATFFLSLVLLTVGSVEMLAVVSIACFAGGLLTIWMGTETKKLSLDDVSEIFKSFYDTFDKISANLLATAKTFNSILSRDYATQSSKAATEEPAPTGSSFDSRSLAAEIKLMEHNGDELVHDAFTKLAKKFLAPIDRQDITALLKTLDDVLDFIDATTSRIEVYHVERITPEMVEFSEIILRQTQAIRNAVISLKSGRAQVVISESAIKIDELENEADNLLRDSLGKMFDIRGEATATSAFKVMKTKEIYEYLETTTDKAEDVADVLRNLLFKYSL